MTPAPVPSCEKDLSARDRLAPGSRYELISRIASGGMGTVYLGRLRGPAGFLRLVALKRAHDHLVRDPSFARMFRSEARVASRLHHPNVVAVHDVEELEDELVLVMDYVEGGALSSLMSAARRHPLAPEIALRVLLDAAAGLEAAHTARDERGRALGVVHRDVSPENVLVGTDGVARISDFGVAKVLRATAGATDGRDLKGKLAYMAPEQIRRGKIDARSDVFALGVVAWEALTERRLFRAQNEVATLQRVLAMTPEAPSALRPGLAPEMDAVILRALEKQADARWPSARAFADALERAAREGGLEPATPAQVGEHVWRCVGHVLDARRRALTEEGRRPEPPEEASGVRVTASVPHAPPVPNAPPTDPGSVPSGFVYASILPGTVTAPAAPPRPFARLRAQVMPFLVGGATILLAAGGVSLGGETAPPEPGPHRAIAAPAAASAVELGGHLAEVTLLDVPVEALPPVAAPPLPTVRAALRAERPRARLPRPAAPTPRELAAPNPYGPAPSSSALK